MTAPGVSRSMGWTAAGAWLDAHRDEVFTTEQFAQGAGIPGQLAATILREASDRDWISQVPGGWCSS